MKKLVLVVVMLGFFSNCYSDSLIFDTDRMLAERKLKNRLDEMEYEIEELKKKNTETDY